MKLCIGSENTAHDLSNDPKMRALSENFTSWKSVENWVAKKWLVEKRFESCAYDFESKNILKWLWVEYSGGMGSGALPNILWEYSSS